MLPVFVSRYYRVVLKTGRPTGLLLKPRTSVSEGDTFLYVAEVRGGSQGELAGVQKDDVLLCIDASVDDVSRATSYTTVADAKIALSTASPLATIILARETVDCRTLGYPANTCDPPSCALPGPATITDPEQGEGEDEGTEDECGEQGEEEDDGTEGENGDKGSPHIEQILRRMTLRQSGKRDLWLDECGRMNTRVVKGGTIRVTREKEYLPGCFYCDTGDGDDRLMCRSLCKELSSEGSWIAPDGCHQEACMPCLGEDTGAVKDGVWLCRVCSAVEEGVGEERFLVKWKNQSYGPKKKNKERPHEH